MYDTFLAPLLQTHEARVDAQLDAVATRVSAAASSAYARASGYARARFLEFVASLPQQPPQPAGGTGFVPRNANEAAAMALLQKAR